MADYYPLLARALDALPDRTPALRKAVYDRARGALIGQLRNLQPPLPEADIDLERQALDAAIERLEAVYGVKPAPAPELPPAPPPPAKPEPPPRPARVPKPAPAPPVREPKPVPPPPAAAPPPEAVPPPPPPPRPAQPAAPPVSPPPAEARAAAPPAEALPEPGPPPAFVPFVPPSRKARPEEAPAPPAEAAAAAEPGPAAADAPNGRRRPRLDVKAPRAGRSRSLRNLVVGGVLAAVIGLIAIAAILLADKRTDLPAGAGEGPDSGRPAPEAKLSDRVGGERAEGEARPGGDPGSRADVAVAQRAVLYEENPSDPKAAPAATQGRVVWRLEAVNGEQGQPLQSAVRANVEFPDAGLTLAMTVRRNLDATLPASHTIELAFTNYGPGEKRGVQEIGLIQLKDEESARGAPVSGLPVRVRDNLFLIGLSNLPSDIERNTEMLTRRNWFDLAVRYKSGPRAILSFEKGAAGARVVQSAFDQWRE